MGIYIKGMEMPKNCGDCRFCSGQADTDYGVCAWCEVDGNARDAYTRQDCPLVPVPPHGRLIDADAMEKTMSDTVQGDIRGYPYSDTTWNMAFEWIDHQPAIISASKEGE